VGLSQVVQRSVRHETSGIVRRFTPQWHYVSDYVLPGVGMVLAILPIDLDLGDVPLEPFEAHSYCGDYNPLEPGNVYHVSRGRSAVFPPEWHAGEETHRWTAARESRMTVVVNPGETTLVIRASSSFPGSYWTEVLLNKKSLGALRWLKPGNTSSQFSIPPGLDGRCEVVFRVPHLWQPSACLRTDDERMLGVSIQELNFF
jgi:hypothetical protein